MLELEVCVFEFLADQNRKTLAQKDVRQSLALAGHSQNSGFSHGFCPVNAYARRKAFSSRSLAQSIHPRTRRNLVKL